MAELIELRKRIKAIETIKKMSHAMRLIAMSAHSKYKHFFEPLAQYEHAMSALFYKLVVLAPEWENPLLYPPVESHEHLVIVIGSQKGLCGNFNFAVFKAFEHYIQSRKEQSFQYIAVGNKAVEFFESRLYKQQLIKVYPSISLQTGLDVSERIAQDITSQIVPFASVTIIHNVLKKFFMQKPVVVELLPHLLNKHPNMQSDNKIDYVWEQHPHEILDQLIDQYLQTHIYAALFKSLLAEQAARFISMDSSTRNAENMLQETKLWYNKLRQSKITKELTERSQL